MHFDFGIQWVQSQDFVDPNFSGGHLGYIVTFGCGCRIERCEDLHVFNYPLDECDQHYGADNAISAWA